jgi:hypothetical protein
MSRQVQRVVATAFAAFLAWGGVVFAQQAQPGPGGRGRAGARQGVLPLAEVERLFDSYVAMQAQDALKLTDEQFPQFLARLKVLQQTRRQHLAARHALVAGLDNDLKVAAPPEGALALTDALRKLRELDARYSDDLRKAYEGLDQVLDVSQQARFRVFEESVERRKIDLMLRARRSAAANERDR